jgi:xanthine dehydrogenase accessory factor
MREIYANVARRLRDRVPFVAATLVATRGAKASAIGTTLLVDGDGSFAGDIGAGCHEGEIVERATAMLAADDPAPQLLTFDIDDEVLVGSGCGASLDIVVWRPSMDFEATASAIAAGRHDVTFSLEGVTVDIPRKERLVVVGATALAAELTTIARRCDYAVTVVDPRPAFATSDRHPEADRLVVAWPDDADVKTLMRAASAIAIVSHDVKLDVPALRVALASSAHYIGLLGNRRVQAARRAALLDEGFDEAQLARIRGPAGLDIGGTTDGQTALSILAEILAAARGRSATPLSRSDGPIHP